MGSGAAVHGAAVHGATSTGQATGLAVFGGPTLIRGRIPPTPIHPPHAPLCSGPLRTGIIFLIVQYNHIHVSLRAAAMGGRSSEGGSGSGGGGAQQAAASGAGGGGGGASSTAAAGIGRTGLTNLKECEVRGQP